MKTLTQVIDETVGENAMRVLAKRLGVSITQVCRWKLGRRGIGIDMAVRLGNATGHVAIPQRDGTFRFLVKEDIARAKFICPAVQVMVDGRVIQGHVRHSRKDWLAKVLIDLNGEREVLEFTWSAIARAAYHGEVLLA